MGTGRFIATNLQEVIERQGVIARVVAKEIGKSPSLMTHILKGRRTIGKEDAETIANFFRLPMHMLFREVEK